MSDHNIGRTYVQTAALITTTDGKCPDGYIEVETVQEAPMLRELLRRAHEDLVKERARFDLLIDTMQRILKR